jgi:hypothetical protein
MAELLDKLLENAEKFDKINRILGNVEPPSGIDEYTWLYKEELPLHLINYLREQTTKILSENLCKQTPCKVKSTTKYNYNSPVKSVRKEPMKKVRKEKKKIKLFPATGGNDFGGGGTPKSNIDPGAETDGVGPIEKFGRFQKTPPTSANSSVLTPKDSSMNRSAGEKSRKKHSPSPQPLNLSDFITFDTRKGSASSSTRSPKKTKARHNSVNKCSTPVNLDSFMTRLDKVEEGAGRGGSAPRLGNGIGIENKEIFPEIGQSDGDKKRRIKPISLGGSSSNNSGFGQVSSRTDSHSGSSLQFRVAEIDREDSVDARQLLVREAASFGDNSLTTTTVTSCKTSQTPFKNGAINGSAALSHVTPIKQISMMTPNKNNR